MNSSTNFTNSSTGFTNSSTNSKNLSNGLTDVAVPEVAITSVPVKSSLKDGNTTTS